MRIFLFVGLVLLILCFVFSILPGRRKKINNIIFDLKDLQLNAKAEDQYALLQLIEFYKYIRTLPGFFIWGLARRKKIIGANLLELADLPLPRWESELYADLSYIERKNFPGLSKPLKSLLVNYLISSSDLPMLDLGCGSMEVERQALIEALRVSSLKNKIIIGIDLSPEAYEAIKKNFSDFPEKIGLKQIDEIEKIDNMKVSKPTIVFYCGDALDFASLHGHKYGLIFSSRFRHHLSETNKQKLDKLSQKFSHYVIEYDDYRTNASWIPPLFTAWNRPVLLGAAEFSQLRQPAKKELVNRKKSRLPHIDVQIFNPPGSYAISYASYDVKKKVKDVAD